MLPLIRSWAIIRRILIWKKAWHWARYFLAQSGVFEDERETNSARARLRKDAHVLEKGLSLPEIRPFFGKPKILKLIEDIETAQANKALDNDREIAEAVIGAYVKWHVDNGHFDSFIDSLKARFPSKQYQLDLGGAILLEKIGEDHATRGFDSLVLSRRTIRNFSEKPVPREEIEAALRVAWSSPSVCNRQPWFVAIEQDKEKIAGLLRWQGGNRGFGESINTLLVVCADTKAFVEDYELFEPFVDAGIMSGVLVNVLHARGIGSCCLNLCVSHRVAERVIRELDVQKHLFPVMMIGCGYPQDDCKVAISARGPIVT